MLTQSETGINGDNPVEEWRRKTGEEKGRKECHDSWLVDYWSPAQKLKQDICHLFALLPYLQSAILRTESSFLLTDTKDETNSSKAEVLYAMRSVFW